MLLDAAVGEPKWLWSRIPHPAVMMGNVVTFLERRLNRGENQRRNGIVTALLLVLIGVVLGLALSSLGAVVEAIIVAILLAQRSLVQHVAAVSQGLRLSVEAGQRAVSMIVSRNTEDMTAPQVARSAIESAAENLSDGVVAPIFWYLVAGLPGLIVYKFINTADSMIGYMSPRYRMFGRSSARLDDVLNYVPARLTSFAIAALGRCLGDWYYIKRDARRHKSPNAGWPEAAMARVLNVSLAGPRSYDGQMQDFPWVHPTARKEIGASDIDDAVLVLWKTWAVILIVTVILAVIPW